MSNAFLSMLAKLEGAHRVTHNVLALGAVADFGAQNSQYTTKVDAR
jgi:hypothetical protein